MCTVHVLTLSVVSEGMDISEYMCTMFVYVMIVHAVKKDDDGFVIHCDNPNSLVLAMES